jgi:hypothetical protein
MQAAKKLDEARFFLDWLSRTPQDTTHADEFMYILSAFLNSWKSVLDVLLYDYAEKFSLGLSREERITDRDFEVAARALQNTQASSFVHWWRQQLSLLSQNPLWTKRKIIVHRGYPPTMRKYTVFVTDSIAVSSTISVYGSSTPPISSGSSSAISPAAPTSPTSPSHNSQHPITTTTPNETRIEIRFADLQDRSVVDYCQQAFHEIERIVNSAFSQFRT